MKLTPYLLAAALSITSACTDEGGGYIDAGTTDPDDTDAQTADVEPPDTTITSAPASPSSLAQATFEFTADEDDVTYRCRLDGGAFADCTTPHVVSAGDGERTFEVAAVDAAGNQDETPAAHTWTVDTDPPETTITQAPPLLDNSTAVTFEFGSDEAGTFECRLDGGDFAACSTPHGLADLTDGEHAFEVRAVDAAGNTDASPAAHTWTIDSTTPDTVIDTGPTGVVASAAASFTFSSPDAGAGASFECRLDGAGFSGCTSPASYAGLGQGEHTFAVRVRDAVGNVDPTPASRTWSVDTVAPNTTIDSGPSGATGDNDPQLTFSSEAGAVFWCRLDTEAAFTPCTSPKSYTDAADGSRTFSVYACDAVGNCDASPATRTWTIDTVAPTTTINSGPSGATSNNDPQLTFSSEAGAVFWCRLDTEAAFTPCTSPKSYTNAPDGNRTFSVFACDAVGNCDASPATRTWSIDTVAPTTTINSGPSGLTNNNDPQLTFSSEAGATFQCRLDTEPGYTGCSSPKSYTNAADGSRTFSVYACDAVGNCDASPATRTWTIDTVAPQTTLSSTIAEPWPVDYGSFSLGHDSQPGFSGFQCSLDGVTWSGCAASYSATFGYGSFTLRARGCDTAGNCDASPATFSWTASPGLVAYLPLDGDLANTTTLGPAHDGVAVEAYNPAQYGLGLLADDGNGLVVTDSPRPMSTSPDGGYTISAWSYPAGVHRVLDFQGDTGCYVMDAPADLFPGNSYVCCRGGDGADHCTGALPVMPKQGWRHVALVSTPDSYHVNLFVNGQEWGSIENPTGAPFFDDGAAELVVGGGTTGFVDDVRLYNRWLAPEEICLLAGGNDGDGCYSVGPDLQLTMNGVFDDIGSWNRTATNDGGSFLAGLLSLAIQSAAGDFVMVRDLGGVGMYWQPDLLFSFWYRDTSGAGANAVLWDMRCDGAECNGTGGIRVAENGAGLQVCFAAAPSGGACANLGAPTGSWHHLAIRTGNSWTGTAYVTRPLQLFLDGKPAAQLTPPANTNVFTNLPSFTAIGGYFESNGTAAVLDETRIYASFVPDDLICALSMGAWNGAACN